MTRPWERPSTGTAAERVAALAAHIPVLETGHLRLRAPRIGDFPIYARFALDKPERDETAWLDFCQMVAGWTLRGYGPWTVERKDGGDPVGAIIINHEYGDPEAEIGWVAAHAAEGRGFVTEAARAARGHAFSALGFDTLVSYIAPDNARSVAVAERFGAIRDHKAEAVFDEPIRVYRHHREARA